MKKILPVIVISQFFCTSVWFAGNAVLSDIVKQLALDPGFLAHLTSAVQFGFISGTLVFAALSISDRISPSKVFFACSIVAAIFNIGISFDISSSSGLLIFRFLTGFFLAGIYPVGMKIASDYYQKGLGKSLGFLVGALVIGTAFPHLLKSLTAVFPWRYVIYATSLLSVLGGAAIFWYVPDGPYRKSGQKPEFGAFLKGFRNKEFRAAAFGYFGHMWELYTFWAFVPIILATYKSHYPDVRFDVSFLSFLIIASGGISCFLSGLISQYYGVKRTATTALFLSCLCCLSSPLMLLNGSIVGFTVFLFIWGMTVTADSPLFSTLVAQNAPAEAKGSSLTIVNCIGFSITIISIQIINALTSEIDIKYLYVFLAAGPIIGLCALIGKKLISLMLR
jgi:MFS family permease